MNVPYVGVLLNRSMFKGIPTGKTQTEKLAFYDEGAKKYGVKPCYFCLEDVSPKRDRVKAYVKTAQSYQLIEIPLPPIIHNRALYFSRIAKNKITQLAERGIIIFNRWNRYGKLYIHSLLVEDPAIADHLPETVSGSLDNLRYMMGKHRALFLKPDSGSIGAGIMRIEKKKNKWVLPYREMINNKRVWLRKEFQQQIPLRIQQAFEKRAYLIQEALPLAEYKKRPFDFRVSVQRNFTGEWSITGIVGKVAKAGHYLSNVGQGGKVYTIQQLLQEYPNLKEREVVQSITQLSLAIVERLSMVLPDLADVGLDIGISNEGFPFFIECNGRDQRYSFRNGALLKEWKNTYSNPMGYARYLMEIQGRL
ncbi:YheC/YheD family protein [Aneurinibacillus sp. Ricciae_BoGa-3]|uniref:YheC/YheD family endospore coat-associated protein n=1 Tax=Aneurinibacillus sp. Ricciae_BoGa-3 TaxID=3022697 RepID=UPI0023412F1C|nr:YheC/YheD family protein [Aneurinibacillus sp. Ricciae_BoGa-3]WCK52789.1 YheC/YheD family protein [Aneurinibacillus sp. Ricciae_BoGa-3]